MGISICLLYLMINPFVNGRKIRRKRFSKTHQDACASLCGSSKKVKVGKKFKFEVTAKDGTNVLCFGKETQAAPCESILAEHCVKASNQCILTNVGGKQSCSSLCGGCCLAPATTKEVADWTKAAKGKSAFTKVCAKVSTPGVTLPTGCSMARAFF